MRNILSFPASFFVGAVITISCFRIAVGQDVEQVQRRIYEQIDDFMSPPLERLEIWSKYIDLGGFPNYMDAPDRDAVSKYLYSYVFTLQNFLPFYGLDNGFFFGYLHGGPDFLSSMFYREPGEAGYSLSGDDGDEMLIHLDTCVDGKTGDEKQCILREGDKYISCINGCELVKCNDVDSQRDCSVLSGNERDDCESKITWCRNYVVEDVTSGSTTLGDIPRSTYCFNSQGINSQIPGEIVFLDPESGNIEFGDCTFESGALVDRELSGPYADCGGDGAICNTTFVGGYINEIAYDPRYKKWYTDAKKAMRPEWSDVYVFNNAPLLGISATLAITTKDGEGRNVFHGVLGADLILDDISEFLVAAFQDTNFSVAVYEAAEPHYMIGTSTGSDIVFKVLAEDTSQPCTGVQDMNGECTLDRISIEDFDNSTEDVVLQNAHNELKEQEDEGTNPDQLVTVKEDPTNVMSRTYLATFVFYNKSEANLEWIILVTEPLERDEEDSIQKGEDSLFIFMCVVAALGFTLCSGFFLLLFQHRHERIVILADYKLTAGFIVACASLNLGTLSMLGERSDKNCMINMWVLNMLVAIALSFLLIKTLRTWKLLGSSPSTSVRFKMSSIHAWLRVLPIPLAQAAILTIFSIVDPPRVVEEVNNDGRTPLQSLSCQHESSAYEIIQTIFYISLVVTGCVLAFLTRHIDPRFADAKALLFVMYNIAFTVIMIGAIIILVGLSDSARAALTAIGIFWITVFSSAVSVVPRVNQAKQERKNAKLERSRLRTSKQRQIKQISSMMISDSNDVIHESEDTLKVLVCSANIGNAEPTLPSMMAWIPQGGYTDGIMTLHDKPIDAERFDIIAIGMQESTWAATEKCGDESDDEIDMDASQVYLAALEGADTVALREMEKTILGEDYALVKEEVRGQMRLYIWALKGLTPFLEDVKVSGANTGIGNVLANKGGIIISFQYQKTRFSFMSAHLAAHEGESHYQARCENVRDILRSSKTFDLSQKFDLSLSSHHMFVFGDLNFRTKFDEEAAHEENVQRALKLIEEEDFYTLYSHDELHKGVKEGDLLVDFQTLPCRFHPTFKVLREPGFVYKEQRTPSYTDRILFKSGVGLKHCLLPLSYEPCVDFVTSDHKPIRGAFSIVTNEMIDSVDLGCKFRMVFSDMECSDLPAADIDGKSDPFLMFVWDSIDLKDESKRGFRFSELFSGGDHSWPQTKYISKNLNPKWKGKEIVLVSTGHEVRTDSILYVGAFDYDFGQTADVLGALPLSILDLTNMGDDEYQKVLNFDQALHANGKYVGKIKFKLVVSKFIG